MIRILLVDEVDVFRNAEAIHLAWSGFILEEASSGEAALKQIEQDPPDLLLLALRLPDISGVEVCRRIREDLKLTDMPIIMVTSSRRDEDIREAVKAGCDDYLIKPIDSDELNRKVGEHLGHITKRHFRRVPASMQIWFEDFRGIFFEYARDISRSGVFIEMAHPLAIGTRLRLSFSLPEPHNHPVLAYGRVVRVKETSDGDPGGVGVAFIHIDENSQNLIDNLSDQPGDDKKPKSDEYSQVSYQLDQHADKGVKRDPAAVAEEERGELLGRLADVQQDHLRLSSILALIDTLQGITDPRRILEVTGQTIGNLMGVESFGIYLFDEESAHLKLVEGHKPPQTYAQEIPRAPSIKKALEYGQTQVLNRPTDDSDKPRVLATAPIRGPGPERSQIWGLICLFDNSGHGHPVKGADRLFIQAVGRQTGQALHDGMARKQADKIDLAQILENLK